MPCDKMVVARIREAMAVLRQATIEDSVGNDQCAYSFDSPYSEKGLYTNLKTFKGVGHQWLEVDARRSGGVLYAHQKWRRVPTESPKDDVVVLGVGVEGGFASEEQEYEVVKEHSLCVIMEDGSHAMVSLPCTDLPEYVSMIVQSVLDHAGSGGASSAVAQWALDDGPPPVSKYAAELRQLPDPPRLSADPKTWRCASSGDTENLWLNLSTGYIGGGRDQSAFGGPKGSNGALLHFEQTGRKYPLVVKLGTISGASAEVYSYAPDEDCRVEDPELREHLAHFGIDPTGMTKTEKTTSELEVDANAKFEWSAIAESGERLVPLSEPGKIGLVNLGNSCYLNSVVQLLSSVPEIADRYAGDAQIRLVNGALASIDVDRDALNQAGKLLSALTSDTYAKPAAALKRQAARLADTPLEEPLPLTEAEATADAAATVAPRAFKRVFASGHTEFSTGRQQDAAEYLFWLLDVLQRAEHAAFTDGRLAGDKPTKALFEFGLSERTQCASSKRSRYKTSRCLCLDLPVPRELVQSAAARQPDEPDLKRSKTAADDERASTKPACIDLADCLDVWAAEGLVEDFYSTATKQKGAASRTLRLATCPRYLFLKLNRYYVDYDTWEPKKLAVEINVPEDLDLSKFIAAPRNPDEPLLPDDEDRDTPSSHEDPPLVPDETILAQLVSMGFDENGCRRACLATRNAGTEAAMEWVLTHSTDADFAAPLDQASGNDNRDADQAAVAELASLGFTQTQAEAALKACDSNKERAADWLFSHIDDIDAACQTILDHTAKPSPSDSTQFDDGPPTYELIGFISHIGKSTASGHYVCHIKHNDGHFYIFDDEKVARSLKPPKSLGYLYLYRRSDVAPSRS